MQQQPNTQDPEIEGAINSTQTNGEHPEPVNDVVPSAKEYGKRLAVVRETLRSLGWRSRSPEDIASIQQKREKKLRTEIEDTERKLGRKLSEESVRMIQQNHESAYRADEEAYTAQLSELLRKESELMQNIDDLKPDIQRAKEYWGRVLEGESRIETPMNPNCKISVVIPAFDEQPERVMRQIESLKKQKDIPPDSFEVVYVINNDVAGESDRSKAVAATNARLMDFLRQDHGICIHVIDKSSSGNEIVNCNVGKARSRGVAESSLRFQELGRNGIVIQTDADTWTEDEHYLSKVKSMMDSNPEVVGVAGGINLEWNPDTKDPQERVMLKSKIDRFFLRKIAEKLAEFLSTPNKYGHFSTSFMGANMISRSFESAVVGGVPEIKGGEDGEFGSRLEAYGRKKGKTVIGAKHKLFMTTALRESDRTASSLKKVFDSIDPNVPERVPNAFATINSGEPQEVELNEAYITRLKAAIREKEGGSEFVDDFEQSMAYIRLG